MYNNMKYAACLRWSHGNELKSPSLTELLLFSVIIFNTKMSESSKSSDVVVQWMFKGTLSRCSARANLTGFFHRKTIELSLCGVMPTRQSYSWALFIVYLYPIGHSRSSLTAVTSHTRPSTTFYPFQKLSFGGRLSNVSMTIVVFISCQFHSHVRSSLD